MDTAKIRALANGAREELRKEVSARLDAILSQGSDERLSRPDAMRQLDRAIAERGRADVVESAAYTWFNRLCALRFMDANGYTPTPVVTPRVGTTVPAILADAQRGIFDPEYGFSAKVRERVASLLVGTTPSKNATEDAYACLVQAVCEHYAAPMGYLFSEQAASSLLMPSGLLAQGSILRSIVDDMDEDACTSVEVLGWLYQFYIAERKKEVQDGFKAKGKAKKKAGSQELGPVTQLFTPEYIVRFLTQNSLGRLWMLNNPGSTLADGMEYYVAPEGDEPHLSVSSVSEIRVVDPACGSGHILVYAYDLLFAMYEEEGWNPEDIPAMILQNNLCGLEIDPRAAEIAKFALEMKALEHDPRFLEKDIDADVRVLRPVALEPLESAELSKPFKDRVGLLDAMEHMDEVGSLYAPAADDEAAIEAEIAGLGDARHDDMIKDALRRKLQTMLANVQALSGTYHCVIANPPYLGSGNMESWLSDWVRDHYPDEKGDLCTCFISRGLGIAKREGYTAEVTMQSWMFLSSYEKMRKSLIDNYGIVTMAHLGAHGFDAIGGEVVQTTATVFCKERLAAEGAYVRLVDESGENAKAAALREAVHNHDCGWFYCDDQQRFKAIPGWPIAYWASRAELDAFVDDKTLAEIAAPRQGLATADNDRFLRLWWEVVFDRIGFGCPSREGAAVTGCKWFPMSKGGLYRKWYGNIDYIVNWENDGYEIRHFFSDTGKLKSRPQNMDSYFHEYIGWTAISSGAFAMRYYPVGFIANAKGPGCFAHNKGLLLSIMGMLNSSVGDAFLKVLAPTLDYSEGPIGKIPVIPEEDHEVEDPVDENISLSRTDWDSFETSWDFTRHPLVRGTLVSDAFDAWSAECQERFDQLKANEEELNRIFARIYHMEGEVPIEVPDDKVSVRLADLQRDVKSLISYGIGCLFGRYSLDKPGLVLADQGSTVEDYLAQVPEPMLMPNEDNVLPITQGNAWFDDDVVDSLYRFLAAAYGEDTLDANVSFIEDALGCDLPTYFARDFYNDHLKTYQKRPIYWLFQSPKKSFSCLIYMHRYDEGTVGDILTKYLRPYEGKLRGRIELLSRSEAAKDAKEADVLRAQVDELEGWERDVMYQLAHDRVHIDLDDGVKVNYNKFPHALAKVPGLSDWK